MSLTDEAFERYPDNLSAHEVERLVPGFPVKYYVTDQDGTAINYRLGVLDLDRVVENPVFQLGSSNIYQRRVVSAKEWEREEPRGILTPWQEIEDDIAKGADVPPLIVRAIGDGMFRIIDGHHRASMARHLGLTAFPAYVDCAGHDVDLAHRPAPAALRPELTSLDTPKTWDDLPARATGAELRGKHNLDIEARPHLVYELRQVPLADIDFPYTMSGSEWDGRSEGDPSHTPGQFVAMEQALKRGEPLPPVVITNMPDEGRVALGDGRHRVSIARHLGMTHVPAYVHDDVRPTLGEIGEAQPTPAASGESLAPRER